MQKIAFLTVLSLSLFVGNTFAQAATIQDDMKQIGALFGQISKAVNDPSQNQASAVAAGQLVALFQDTLAQVPDAIAQMQPADQTAAVTDYQSLINQEVQEAAALQSAFLNNDNATAASVLQQMNAAKQDGHGKYK